uniref:Uncharacterized protein n=1 Tax=Cacopsylla melanoneura TaxID=428564 RepID=A0A8D8VUT1_9HEMI
MPLALLKEVYHALVQSALEYGVCGYGRADKTLKKSLEVIQNSLLKIIYRKNKRYSTSALYKNMKVLNLNNLFFKNICTHVYQNKNTLIKYKEHNYKLRTPNIQMDRFRTTKGQHAVNYIGIKLYSTIPQKIKNHENDKKFKLELKGWLKKVQGN